MKPSSWYVGALLVLPAAFAVPSVNEPGLLLLHGVELAIGIYIGTLALKLSRIVQPVDIFVYLYLTVGFAVLNSLVEMVPHFTSAIPSVVQNVTGRVLFIGMLLSLAAFFFKWNAAMRGKTKMDYI